MYCGLSRVSFLDGCFVVEVVLIVSLEDALLPQLLKARLVFPRWMLRYYSFTALSGGAKGGLAGAMAPPNICQQNFLLL